MICLEVFKHKKQRNLDEIIRYILSKNIKLIFAGMIAPLSYGQNYKGNLMGSFHL